MRVRPHNVVQALNSVTLANIVNTPSMNGQQGRIIDCTRGGFKRKRVDSSMDTGADTMAGTDGQDDRYHVQLASGRVIAVRARNIVAPKSTVVGIRGLCSTQAAQYNGKRGVIRGFDGQRYTGTSIRIGNRYYGSSLAMSSFELNLSEYKLFES